MADDSWRETVMFEGNVLHLKMLLAGQEPNVRRDFVTLEFQLQAAVEISPQVRLFGFTGLELAPELAPNAA